jgi:hypothetical protein
MTRLLIVERVRAIRALTRVASWTTLPQRRSRGQHWHPHVASVRALPTAWLRVRGR